MGSDAMTQKPAALFLSFEEWKRQNREMTEQEIEGPESSIICKSCDGEGVIVRENPQVRAMYEHQRKADEEKLKQWNKIIKEEAS